MGKFFPVLVFIIFRIISFGEAQSWQSLYDGLLEHYKSGDYELVSAQFPACLELAEKEHGKSSKAYAYTLKLASGAFYETGEYDQGIRSGQQELEVLSQIIDTASIDYANSVHMLGLNYLGAGKFGDALGFLLKASLRFHSHYGEASESYAIILSELGDVYSGLENYGSGIDCLEKSLEVYNKAGSLTENYIYTIQSAANLYLKTSQFKAAFQKATLLQGLLIDNGLEKERIYGDNLLAGAEAAKGLGDHFNSAKYYSEYLRFLIANGSAGSGEYVYAVHELAAIYQSIGNLSSYDSLINANRDILVSSSGARDTGFSGYLNLAVMYQNKRQFKDAESAYKDAFLIMQNNPDQELSLRGTLYENYALLKYSMRAYDTARQLINQAIVIFRGQPDNTHGLASALNIRGMIFKTAGELKPGKESLIEALRLCSSSDRKETDLHAKILENLSTVELELNQISGALSYIKQAIEIRRVNTGEKSAEYVNVLNSYGAILGMSGNFASALDTIRLAYEILGAGPEVNVELGNQIITNLGSIGLASGNSSLADSLYGIALKAAVEFYGAESFESGKIMINLARAREALGRYREAESDYRAGIRIMSAQAGPKDSEYLSASNAFGKFYQVMGNYEEAERIYSEIIEGTSDTHPIYGITLQNLATLYQLQENYGKAEPLLIEALRLDSLYKGPGDPGYAVSLQNLASLYQKTGRSASAESLFMKALKIDEMVYGKFHPSYARKLFNLATLYQDAGKYDLALPLMQESAAIRKELFGSDHPDYAYGQFGLAMISDLLERDDEARSCYQEALRIYLKQFRELFPALSEKEKTAFYNKFQPVIEAYRDFAIEYAGKDGSVLSDLYDLQLETKAILLNSSSKTRARILNSGDGELVNLFNQWVSMKEQIARLYRYTNSELAIQGIDIRSLERKSNDLEKELSTRSEIYNSLSDTKAIRWKDIRSTLGPGEGAIEIIRIRKNLRNDSIIYACLVIVSREQSENPLLVTFPDGNLMETRGYHRYFNSINYHLEDTESYAVYWEPLDHVLGGINTLYISSDGIFNKINPNTLYDNVSKKYILEKYKIVFVSNTRDILKSGQNIQSSKTAELLGYPDYKSGIIGEVSQGNTTEQNPHLRESFGSGIALLPGTKREVEYIDSLFKHNNWKTGIYTGQEASEDLIKKIKDPGILHVATHGFFLRDDTPRRNVMEDDPAGESALAGHPLLRSGLLLAGAEKGLKGNAGITDEDGNDGILTAYEAMNLSLDRTSIVVLSACETGLGEIKNGEGIYGLQRAFIVAGSSNLVMSLWKVDDTITQELMTGFYSEWLNGKSLFDAFRETQIRIRHNNSEPYFWGAFILVGN
ncbi:MAG TPA: CHAT domain-containing tetratricopeptide repeat protein [Cyclobacteriaceae bacterium]|nr:CHAT domain-containing tetratricopeptide repeat protein [Cyclobacteriaceae bacterium]